MNLNFSPPRRVETRDGERWLIEAPVTSEFWPVWKKNKQIMGEQGYYLLNKKDDRGKNYWILRRLYEKEGEIIKPHPVHPIPVLKPQKLLPHQVKPVGDLKASLVAHRVAFDCSDTGTGKTYTSLSTCEELELRPAIICTKTGIPDWKEACNYFDLNPLFIINWESAKSAKFPYTQRIRNAYTGKYRFEWLIPHNIRVAVIFDEIHRANGTHTQNQALVLGASRYPIIGLSATLADKLSKLKTVGELCGLFKEQNFEDWLSSQGLFRDNYNQWTSLRDQDDMKKFHAALFPQFGTRVRKDNIPGFPDVHNLAKLYPIKSATKQNNAHKKLELQIHKLRQELGQGMQSKILALQTRYKQLAEMLKVDLLAELALEHTLNRLSVAIFVNYDDTVQKLAEKLKTDCLVHGKQTGEMRREAIDNFQKERKRIIICNIKAGGVGISLHDKHGRFPRVSLICPTDNATDLVQALGRIHRAGAKSKAINYLIYAKGTIEEKIYKNVHAKIGAINTLNDGDLAVTEVFEDE